jgi:hypothetical protein
MTPHEELPEERYQEEMTARGIQTLLPRHAGRRESDGWVISPKALGMVLTGITILSLFFSPVFYVRDMSITVEALKETVVEMRRERDEDRAARATMQADIITIKQQIAVGAVHRADLEQRTRDLERKR